VYEYAVIAIGIMLENLLAGKAFLVAMDQVRSNIEEVIVWLEGHFQESFELPIYFDKAQMLAAIIDCYDDKQYAVGRIEKLYRKQFKRNMEFGIENIGYQPTFDFYARALSTCWFGTFGFSDILDPWMAVTKDLENTLELIAASKRILESNTDERSQKEAEKYDLKRILKELLNEFVLWTPQQREALDHLYTNKEALETGQEDLFGVMRRMIGQRADICPIVASKESLFEAFMYHDPKNGAQYLEIIDEWIAKNQDAYENFRQKLQEIEAKRSEQASEREEEVETKVMHDIEEFANQYAPHEQSIVQFAISKNPCLMNLSKELDDLRQGLQEIAQADKNKEYVGFVFSEPKTEKIKRMRSRLKELSLSVHPNFEQWLAEEEDQSVLFHLRLLLSLKLYERRPSSVRFQMLWDRARWNDWREGQKYAFKE
jgi:hypothetical protein